jgi:hypothetical protein
VDRAPAGVVNGARLSASPRLTPVERPVVHRQEDTQDAFRTISGTRAVRNLERAGVARSVAMELVGPQDRVGVPAV